MLDFLLNTPYHSIYWLPDHIHVYEQRIHGIEVTITVREFNTGKIKTQLTLLTTGVNYEYLRNLSQELARKKYAAR